MQVKNFSELIYMYDLQVIADAKEVAEKLVKRGKEIVYD